MSDTAAKPLNISAKRQIKQGNKWKEYWSEIVALLTCPLCQELFLDPYTAADKCGHTFCWNCVIATLEGPGIVKSECPVCEFPIWKSDLVRDHERGNMVEVALRGQCRTRNLARAPTSPASNSMPTSLPDSSDTPAAPIHTTPVPSPNTSPDKHRASSVSTPSIPANLRQSLPRSAKRTVSASPADAELLTNEASIPASAAQDSSVVARRGPRKRNAKAQTPPSTRMQLRNRSKPSRALSPVRQPSPPAHTSTSEDAPIAGSEPLPASLPDTPPRVAHAAVLDTTPSISSPTPVFGSGAFGSPAYGPTLIPDSDADDDCGLDELADNTHTLADNTINAVRVQGTDAPTLTHSSVSDRPATAFVGLTIPDSEAVPIPLDGRAIQVPVDAVAVDGNDEEQAVVEAAHASSQGVGGDDDGYWDEEQARKVLETYGGFVSASQVLATEGKRGEVGSSVRERAVPAICSGDVCGDDADDGYGDEKQAGKVLETYSGFVLASQVLASEGKCEEAGSSVHERVVPVLKCEKVVVDDLGEWAQFGELDAWMGADADELQEKWSRWLAALPTPSESERQVLRRRCASMKAAMDTLSRLATRHSWQLPHHPVMIHTASPTDTPIVPKPDPPCTPAAAAIESPCALPANDTPSPLPTQRCSQASLSDPHHGPEATRSHDEGSRSLHSHKRSYGALDSPPAMPGVLSSRKRARNELLYNLVTPESGRSANRNGARSSEGDTRKKARDTVIGKFAISETSLLEVSPSPAMSGSQANCRPGEQYPCIPDTPSGTESEAAHTAPESEFEDGDLVLDSGPGNLETEAIMAGIDTQAVSKLLGSGADTESVTVWDRMPASVAAEALL